MSVIEDLSGTSEASFGLGVGGARIRNNSGTIEARNAANTALAPIKGSQVSARVSDAGATIDLLATSVNAGIEVKGNAGLAYLDFSQALATDFDARFILNSTAEFQFNGSANLKYAFTRPLETQNTFTVKNGAFGVTLTSATQTADRTFTFPTVNGNREVVARNAIIDPTPTNGDILVFTSATGGPWVTKTLTPDNAGITIDTTDSDAIFIGVSAQLAQIQNGFTAAPEGSVPAKVGGSLVYTVPSGGGGGAAGTTIVPVAASKTFALSDANTLQSCTGTGWVTLTIPSDASVNFPVGTEINVLPLSGRHAIGLQSGITLTNRTVLNRGFIPAGARISLLKTGANAWRMSLIRFDNDLCSIQFTEWLSATEPGFGVQATGSGAGVGLFVNTAVASPSFPGEIRLSTGTSNSGRVYVGTSTGQLPAGKAYYTEHVLSLAGLSDATESFFVRVGAMNDFGGSTPQGVYWEGNHAVNGGLWRLTARDAVNSTSQDSGILIESGIEYRFGVLWVGAPVNEARFYVNGEQIGSAITTNIPTAGTGLGINIAKTLGNTNRFLFVNRSTAVVQVVN